MTDLLARAVAAINAGDCPQGYRLLMSVLRADPGNAAAWFSLGGLLERLLRWPAAVAAFRRADELSPGSPAVLLALGWHLHLAGRTVEAEGVLRRVIELDPGMAQARTNLSHVLATLGRDEEGLRYAMQAVDLDGQTPLVRLGLAFGLFFAKRWEEGWRAFEARIPMKMPEVAGYPWPKWDGERVGTLYLRAEQGLGDSLMMLRYLPAVIARVDRLVLYIQAELMGLCREMWPEVEVVEYRSAAPVDVDAWCLLMSLPLVVGAAEVPYIAGRGGGNWPPKRVGLAWCGDPAHANDGHRSMPLSEMLPLTEMAGIEFVSLQVGARGQADVDACNAHALIRNDAAEIMDVRDTVRVLGGLDLVICVDTAVGHLAGAMGVPCWLLVNQRGRDWRWGRSQEDSEWYPWHRIFARGLDEQWTDVIGRVKAELLSQASAMGLARAA